VIEVEPPIEIAYVSFGNSRLDLFLHTEVTSSPSHLFVIRCSDIELYRAQME